MAMPINDMIPDSQNNVFYDPNFRRVLEMHMGWLRQHPETVELAIDPHHGYKFEGDLYGLLKTLNIEAKHHWLIMRLNDIDRPGAVDENLTSLLIPDFSRVDRIRQMHVTRVKKTGA